MIFLNENRNLRELISQRVFQFWTTVSGWIRCVLRIFRRSGRAPQIKAIAVNEPPPR